MYVSSSSPETMMYGTAARSTSQTISATGKKSTTDEISATPVAACVSPARTMSRFHVAWSTAAASARTSAVVGKSVRIQRQDGDAIALDGGVGPVELAHPAREPVLDLVVVAARGGMPRLAPADDQQALVGIREVRDEARTGAARLPSRVGVGDRLRRRPHRLGLAREREGPAPEHPLEARQRRQRVVEHEHVH